MYVVVFTNMYVCVYIYIPQTVLAQLRGSYLFCIIIPHDSRIAGRQPRYLSPAADSLASRIVYIYIYIYIYIPQTKTSVRVGVLTSSF